MFRRLDAERQTLLLRYDDETLHQIRVSLRRLRTLLKDHTGSEAQHLRRELGKLADTSNAARDWDTLLIRARESLRPQDFALVQPWLEERRAVSHRPVLDMLCSDQWSHVMEDLKKMVKHNDSMLAIDTHDGADLSRAKRHVYRAWCKAQAVDENKNWHKLRVAIKELRYGLETIPKDSRDRSILTALKQCKRLQEYLGIWHDTVIHLRMVREFVHALDPQADSELLTVLGAWCQLMERAAQDSLNRTQSRLEGKGSLLLQ